MNGAGGGNPTAPARDPLSGAPTGGAMLRITARDLARERVADHADWYRHDRNPLRAWLAYQECRLHRLRVPGWILEYFSRVAAELDGLKGAPPRDPAPVVLRALEMTRARGTVFDELKNSDRDHILGSMLEVAQRAPKGLKKRALARRVGKAWRPKVSGKTVERAAKRFKDAGCDTGRLVQ
jgi:hypothetical protein